MRPGAVRCVALLAACLLALAGCSAAAAPGPAAPAGGGWTFTDDLGATVTLDERPTRIVGLTDVVSSLWNYGIAPVGAFGYTGVSTDPRFAGRDLTQVAELGRAYGEIDLEALAATEPDLIVTNAYPVDGTGRVDPATPLYGFADLAQQQAVAAIAPIVAIRMHGSAVEVMDRTAQLAVALGAPGNAGPITESRSAYDAAARRLSAAAGSGREVLVVAAYPSEGLYVAKAPDDPQLRSYADLGVRFVDPGGTDYYWEVVSWENVGRLPADVVLHSQRAMDAAALQGQPTFARTPAAQAGQVFPWVFAGMDHPAQTAYMNELAGWLETARDVA